MRPEDTATKRREPHHSDEPEDDCDEQPALDDAEALLDRIAQDAQERWARGEPATLEHYIEEVPDLLDREELVEQILMTEALLSPSSGSPDHAADLKRRFPELSDRIDLVFAFRDLAEDDTEPSARLGHYELIDEIGRGSFGVVWKAWDTRLRRYLALKLLAASRSDPGRSERTLEEARNAARIDHPHVVKVHAAGQLVDGRIFIDSQLAADPSPTPEEPHGVTLGSSLAEAVRDRAGGLEPREAAAILRDVCRGVAAAHARGVIHRDVKPANIIVTPAGVPMVTDFGLSVSGAGDQTTGVVGTPAYMSPEQARGEPATALSDVYGLGATLLTLLTGRPPFVPDAKHGDPVRSVLDQAAGGRTPSLDAPARLAAICRRAMDGRPDARYPSADEMARDLDAFLRGFPTSLDTSPGAKARLFASRNPVATTLVSALLLVAVIGTVIFVQRLGRERNEVRRALRVNEKLLGRMRVADRKYKEATDPYVIESLLERRDRLWPRRPAVVPAMDAWLHEARSALDRREFHRAARAAEDERRDALSDLLAGLESLEASVSEIEARRAFVAELDRRSLVEPAELWKRCRTEVGSLGVDRDGRDIGLEPVFGLVPLGCDEDSDLWEFWHVESGVRPRRTGDFDSGRVRPTDVSGIVLVLIPGVTYRPTDFSEAVKLAPYFISKFEMTQGQWERVMGSNPSFFRDGLTQGGRSISGRNPIEQIDWSQAREATMRYGLALPTEAQWEYAARGETDTVWWTGDDKTSLAGAANVADASAARVSVAWPTEKSLDDDHVVHAPVGSFTANPFGLHDVVGNVWEWCRDAPAPNGAAGRPGDGLRGEPTQKERMFRGGGFMDLPRFATHGTRYRGTLRRSMSNLGFRPVLALPSEKP